MNPHNQRSTSTTTAAVSVPVKVAAALADLDIQHRRASLMPMTTDLQHATRAARLAVVCARRAGWWRVLKRWTCRHSGMHEVFGEAVIAALLQERGDARYWRQCAYDWTARATGDRHGSGLWATWDHLDGRDQDHAEHGAVA